MADNIQIKDASGNTVTVASDDVGGILHQRVKVCLGADGAAGDLSPGQKTMANSLPVVLPSDQTLVLGAGSAAIGKLAANSGVDIGDVDVASVVPGTGATNLGKAEDAAHSNGDVGVMALAVRRDANTTLAASDNDYAPLQVNADGSLKVAITAGAGSGGTSIADDAAFTPGSTSLTPVGGTYRAARDAVDDGDAGAFAMNAKRGLYASLETPNSDSVMDDTADTVKVSGAAAHDAAVSGSPILNGGYAANAEPTAVANGDVARLLTDLVGKLITLPYANPENFISGKAGPITSTSRTAVIAAQSAGVRSYITQILVTNSHATVGTVVKIEDGTTEIYRGYAGPAGGGFSVTLNVPLRGTAATAVNISCETTGASVDVSMSGYKGV